MPDPRKYANPDWQKRAGRRQLTKPEAEKVERKKVDAEIAAKLTANRKARAKKLAAKPKPKPKPWYKKYNPFDVLSGVLGGKKKE